MSSNDNSAAPPSIALVGSGYWGKNLARNLAALGALHTIADANPETLSAILENHPGVRGASTFTAVLEEREIRAVVLATPAETHGGMVREALLADKDVLVEKPLCLSKKEGDELVELARERNRILMVGHLLWYHPAVLKLQELIEAGELGGIRYIYSNRLNMGKLRREENVLWSFAPHDVSVILGLLGEMPEKLSAHGGAFLHQRIADSTITNMTFPSGVLAHIFVSWLHPFKEQKLVVVGDRKMAVFDDGSPWPEKLTLYPHSVSWRDNEPVANKALGESVALTEEEPLLNECRHFLACVQSRETPRTDGAEGVRVLTVLNACETAMAKDRTVRIDPVDETAPPFFAHETAVLDEGVSVGEKSKIWHFSHLLAGTVVGQRCNIGQNVMIGPNAQVGDGCKIQNNVSVYEGVILEEDVFCGPSMVFTNVVNPRSEISRKKEMKPTVVKRGCTIGANATVVCGHTLGRYSFIGAGAVVTRDVPDHALVVGNPARRQGWVCRCGERLDDSLACPACGLAFKVSKDGGLCPLV